MNAFLILCHKNPNQVIRLSKKCKTKNTDVFVHVDSVMSNDDYTFLKNELNKIGVLTTDRRIHCELDDKSLVEATMILMETARKISIEQNKQYKYYALLSGQDYLITPMRFIEEELKALYPKPLIDCTKWRNGNWVSAKFRKNSKLIQYRNNIEKKIVNKKSLKYYFYRCIGALWRIALQMTRHSDYYYFRRKEFELYGGSAWWILPDQVIDYIVGEYNKKEEYVSRLLATYTPEETFFQTMTMRTPLNKMVELNPTEGKIQMCKTYAYFTDVDKPFCGHPYILTSDNNEMILKLSDYWIARKFDETIDASIYDFVDNNLLEVNRIEE